MKKLGKTAEAENILHESLPRAEKTIATLEGRADAKNYLWAAMAASGLARTERSNAYLKKARELDPSNRWIPFFARLRWSGNRETTWEAGYDQIEKAQTNRNRMAGIR